MRKYTVGIIGNGFVGDGQAFVFSANSEVRIYDINPLRATHTLEEVQECDFVFVAVPTPMREDGSQDLSYIENVFKSATSTPITLLNQQYFQELLRCLFRSILIYRSYSTQSF